MPVYFDDEQKSWYVRMKFTDQLGKHHEKKRRGFKTKREAKVWETGNAPTAGSGDTVGTIYNMYIADYKAKHKVSSYTSKSKLYELYILPHFQGKVMADITPNDIRVWQNTLQITPTVNNKLLSETSLHNICAAFSTLFNFGIKFCDIPRNPFVVTGNPYKRGQRLDVWTPAEFKKFLSVLPPTETIKKMLFTLLFVSGLRVGEACALNKYDLNYTSNTITVNKTVVFSNGTIGTPKTATSNRTVVIPQEIMAELKEYSTHIPGDRLFPFDYPHPLNAAMKKYSEIAGVKTLTCHGLRHSHATMLINNGVPLTTISKRLGHKNPKITLEVYSHFYATSDAEAADVVSSVFCKM